MKRKILISILLFMLTLSFAGCDALGNALVEYEKKQAADEVKEKFKKQFGEDLSDEDAEAIVDMRLAFNSAMDDIDDNADSKKNKKNKKANDNDSEEESELTPEEEKELLLSQYKESKPSPEWNDVSSDDLVFQVDDMMLRPGMNADDFFKMVDSQKIEYEHDFVSSALITANKTETYTITRDGIDWFKVDVRNCKDETAKAFQGIVTQISLCSDAYNFCHFIDGISFDDIMDMDYDEVQTLGEKYFYTWDKKESEVRSTDDQIEIRFVSDENIVLQNMMESGYDLKMANYDYAFIINKNDYSVQDFSISHGSCISIEKHKNYVTDLSQISDSEIERIKELASEEYLKCYGSVHEFTEVEFVEGPYLYGYYLYSNPDNAKSSIGFIFKSFDGMYQHDIYSLVTVYNTSLESSGLEFEDICACYPEDSYDEVIEKLNEYERIQ